MAKRQAKTKSKRTARGGTHGGYHQFPAAGGATVILLEPGAQITLPSGDVIFAPPIGYTPTP